MLVLLGYMVLSLAMGLLAAELLRPDPPSSDPLKDTGSTAAHVRGTMLPLLLGYNKVSPVIGYVGNRSTWEKKVGEIDGGMFHNNTDITQTFYRESGIHFLCIGPAYRLSKITEGGNVIFDTEIARDSTPSGSEFTCFDEGESVFRIYWGEDGQPVDTDLSALTGVATRYPYTCYIYWVKKDLGQSATWKSVEYYLECSAIDRDSDYIDIPPESFTLPVVYGDQNLTTTNTKAEDLLGGDTLSVNGDDLTVYSVSESGGVYTITTTPVPDPETTPTTAAASRLSTQRRGVNPASAMDQLLFEEFPHGLGMSTDLYSTSDLAGIKSTFSVSGSEASPCTLYNKSGNTINSMLSSLLSDYGVFVYPDAVTGQYRFKLIRAGETAVEIDRDAYTKTDAEQVVSHNTLSPDKIMYSFVEAVRSFQSSTILITDDGNATLSGDPNTKKQTINTATDIESASVIASRMDQGNNTREGVRLSASSDLIDRQVGDLVSLEGVGGVYRIASKKANPGDSEMELAVTQDIYSVENNYSLFSTSGISVPLPLLSDASVKAIETNRFINPDTSGYYLIRARGAPYVPFAGLYRSEGDIDYNSVASLDYQTACTLSEALPDDTGGLVDTLTVYELGGDFGAFWEYVNLSEAEWRAGAVCMLIGTEYLFPQSVTDLGSGSYRLNDIIRGRFGSAISDYSVGEVGSFFYLNQVPLIEDSTILAGDTLYLKTRPYSSVEVMPLDYQDAIVLNYAGGGYRPLPPENLNTSDDTNAWVSGTDADLRWDYKSVASGAGQQLSDEPTELSLPEGYFRITILSGTTIVRQTEVLVPTFTYTQAMMSADFGSEPSTFNAEVVEILNGLTSDTDSATINRV